MPTGPGPDRQARLNLTVPAQVRGEVKDGKVGCYQVTLKVGFTLDEG
jgi:flavin-binding protein dodecin